ncbi:MAG: class I tRNA ligase family protein, partial [Ornithinimicrobium sp.]
DNYLELVKERAYGNTADGRARGTAEASASAQAALQVALDVYMRLLAPVLVFACEEIWSWWHTDSVHTQPWPTTAELAAAAEGSDPRMLHVVGRALAGLRKAKSEAKVKMRTEVGGATVIATDSDLDLLHAAANDLAAAGKVTGTLNWEQGSELAVRDVDLLTT